MTDTLAIPPVASPREVWCHEAAVTPARPPEWLWHGYLARGETTLLTSQWKTGKTTLVSVLLSKLSAGGKLGDYDLRLGKAAVVSEERLDHWMRREGELKFGSSVCFFCRPFPGKPTVEEWHALINRLRWLRQQGKIDLVVIDPLASFFPSGGENQADRMLHLLRPLERITSEGAAVLLLHHPRKGEPLSGQAARGSGALCAYADILIEMRLVDAQRPDDRRRLLEGFSRHVQTPRQAVLELSADGRDYLAAALPANDEFEQVWTALEAVLDGVKLTRSQILRAWPAKNAPSKVTLWRWLKQAIELGRIDQEGSGARGDPRRFWIKGQPATWTPDYTELLGL